MSNTITAYTDIWVCTDCLFGHHHGVTKHDGQFYAGESDTPADREPLVLIDGGHVSDNTCSNHRHGQDDATDDDGVYLDACDTCGSRDDENGIDTFSNRPCQGCGSVLGGARYRMAFTA